MICIYMFARVTKWPFRAINTSLPFRYFVFGFLNDILTVPLDIYALATLDQVRTSKIIATISNVRFQTGWGSRDV